MEQIGKILVEARQQRGLTVEDISQITKIRSKYIRALESGNVYDIPGRVYALGFLKSYCEVVDVNYRELQEYFNANYQERDEFAKHMSTPAAAKQPTHQAAISSKRVVVLALLGAMVLLGCVYFFVNHREKNQPPIVPPAVNQPEQNHENQGEPAAQTESREPVIPFDWSVLQQSVGTISLDLPGEEIPPRQEGVEVVVEASGTCWTSVKIDEGESKAETLNRGDIRIYQGISKIAIKWGNAGLVKVTVNGVLQEDIGQSGAVVTREFFAADSEPNALPDTTE